MSVLLLVLLVVPVFLLSVRHPLLSIMGFWSSKTKQKTTQAQPAQPKPRVAPSPDARHFPGLVNISGTYCFMNSTLQALASLTYLQPQIEAIHARAEALDVPTPVIDALRELFHDLNTPRTSYTAIRPTEIIGALSAPPPPPLHPSADPIPYRTANSLFNSREHQDAQELFQLVSECIKNEMLSVDREGVRDRGIAAVLDLKPPATSASPPPPDTDLDPRPLSKTVFDGLTANRRSCVECGYTEAVMHFGFDNWQLAVPRLAASCRLEDCLEDYTRLEILQDCICRNCSIQATQKRLQSDIKVIEEALGITPPQSQPPTSSTSTNTLSSPNGPSSPSKPKPSHSKKKRHKELLKAQQKIQTALVQGRIEDDVFLSSIRLEKVVSRASTKQAMIARPPPVLALHLNRSMHFGYGGASKNMIRVVFPEVLDLTPYTTSGTLSTRPTSKISEHDTPSASKPGPAADEGWTRYRRSSHIKQEPEMDLDLADESRSRSKTVATSGKVKSPKKRSTTPTPAHYAPPTNPRVLYRLAAVVCHRGQHSFGHYICYRRKPKPRWKESGSSKEGEEKGHTLDWQWTPPTLVDPLERVGDSDDEEDDEDEEIDSADASRRQSPTSTSPPNGSAIRRHASTHTSPSSSMSASSLYMSNPSSAAYYRWADGVEEQVGTGKGWLRISDDDVRECGIETVLGETGGVFMLYYEKVLYPRPGVYAGREKVKSSKKKSSKRNGKTKFGVTPSILPNGSSDVKKEEEEDVDLSNTDICGSEETLKPEMKVVDLNGSVGSLISEVGVGVLKTSKKDKQKKEREREEREREREREREKQALPIPTSSSRSTPLRDLGYGGGWDSMSMSTSMASSWASSASESSWGSSSLLSASSSSKPFGARIIRSVSARARSGTPLPMSASTPSILSSASPTPAPSDTTHLIPPPAAPLLSSLSMNSNGHAGVYSGLSATKPVQPSRPISPTPSSTSSGLGSRSTRVIRTEKR